MSLGIRLSYQFHGSFEQPWVRGQAAVLEMGNECKFVNHGSLLRVVVAVFVVIFLSGFRLNGFKRPATSQPVSRSASPPGGESVSRSVPRDERQSVSQSVSRRSIREPAGESVCRSVGRYVCTLVSQSIGRSVDRSKRREPAVS